MYQYCAIPFPNLSEDYYVYSFVLDFFMIALCSPTVLYRGRYICGADCARFPAGVQLNFFLHSG